MLVAAMPLAMVIGCGGLPATVEGVVTLDGRPLSGAIVSFYPDTSGPVAYGMSLDDGSYRLKTGAKQQGLRPGSYRVTVAASDTQTPEAGDRMTPRVYDDESKTPLRVEVVKGANRIPLALESTFTASSGKASR